MFLDTFARAITACMVYVVVMGQWVLTNSQRDAAFPLIPKLHGQHAVPERYFGGLLLVILVSLYSKQLASQLLGSMHQAAMDKVAEFFKASIIAAITFSLAIGLFVLTKSQVDPVFPLLPKLHGDHAIPGRYFCGMALFIMCFVYMAQHQATSAESIQPSKLPSRRALIYTLAFFMVQVLLHKAEVPAPVAAPATAAPAASTAAASTAAPTAAAITKWISRKAEEWPNFLRVGLNGTCGPGGRSANCTLLGGSLRRSWKGCNRGSNERLLRNLQRAQNGSRVFKVAVFGGSITAGSCYPSKAGIWTNRLQVYLTRILPPGTKVEVSNLALPASGVAIPMSKLSSYKLAEKDLVISEFAINEGNRKSLQAWYKALLDLNGPQIVAMELFSWLSPYNPSTLPDDCSRLKLETQTAIAARDYDIPVLSLKDAFRGLWESGISPFRAEDSFPVTYTFLKGFGIGCNSSSRVSLSSKECVAKAMLHDPAALQNRHVTGYTCLTTRYKFPPQTVTLKTFRSFLLSETSQHGNDVFHDMIAMSAAFYVFHFLPQFSAYRKKSPKGKPPCSSVSYGTFGFGADGKSPGQRATGAAFEAAGAAALILCCCPPPHCSMAMTSSTT
jgi:hypothetical protein